MKIPSILVVDDEPNNFDVVEKALKSLAEGFNRSGDLIFNLEDAIFTIR